MKAFSSDLVTNWEIVEIPPLRKEQADLACKLVVELTHLSLLALHFERCVTAGVATVVTPIDALKLTAEAPERHDIVLKKLNDALVESPAGLYFVLCGLKGFSMEWANE